MVISDYQALRTRDKTVNADLRAGSLFTVPPTPPAISYVPLLNGPDHVNGWRSMSQVVRQVEHMSRGPDSVVCTLVIWLWQLGRQRFVVSSIPIL
ncbi:hypothetical protein PoB_005237700 [Plakobranchus ocellatus]|uniref:Uncharacterized protein n=1 Tax=Plakobranchus ocellatus TaxID=259542 RepID=A0AAV4C2N3_9GAST|nr:hypothetical protein PoB_005237700 [Plakobranchus ocellatus]